MKLSGNAILSALMVLAGVLAQIKDIAPPGVQKYVTVGLIVVGAIRQCTNLFVNPDGTPASTAYEPRRKNE